jgi:hypothetical protein
MKLEGLNMSELFFKHGTREALTCQDCSSNMELEVYNISLYVLYACSE